MAKIPNPDFLNLPTSWQTEENRFIAIPSDSYHSVEMMIANGLPAARERLRQIQRDAKEIWQQVREKEALIQDYRVKGREFYNLKKFVDAKIYLTLERSFKKEVEKLKQRFGDLQLLDKYLSFRVFELENGQPSPSQLTSTFGKEPKIWKNSRFIDIED